MKIVIGIIIAAIAAAIAAILLLFVFRSHDLVLCGDIPQQTDDNTMFVTRVYTYDVDANGTLTQIIDKMNANADGHITSEEMAEILAEYQSIVYAPVFTFNLAQEDTNTYVLSGTVFNGLDPDGEEAETDYIYKDMTLTLAVSNGKVLAAQNVYTDIPEDEEQSFVERKVINPVLIDDSKQAAFSLSKDCNSFRVVFTSREGLPPQVDLAFNFDVRAEALLNFSSSKSNIMGVTITGEFDDLGRLQPSIAMNRKIVELETEE